MSKYNRNTTALEVVEGYNLTGRNAIVTGANSGIGVETARALAKTGATVYMTARNCEKAQSVLDDIVKTTGNQNVYLEQLELDSLENVNALVKRFLSKDIPLHILVNNAGISGDDEIAYTKDGFESVFGVNHIGHFVLTNGLISSLKKGAAETGKKSRVINVSSMGHLMSDINYEDPFFKSRPFASHPAYGQSKTANCLFSVELTRRFENEGIISFSLMPGAIVTNIVKTDERRKVLQDMVDEWGKSIEAGAATQTWAAVASELEDKSGLYLEDCQISTLKDSISEVALPKFGYLAYAVDPENAKKCWDLTERLISESK